MQLGDIVGKVTANIKDFEAKMDTVVAKSSETASTSSKAVSGIGTAMTAVGTVALATATAIATGFVAISSAGIKISGELESARQGFVALLGSAELADKTMARIKKEAKATPFEMTGLVAGTQALTAITKDGDKAIDVLLDVGKAIATSGKGQAELDRVILNLQQISSTGKVTEMDIRQFQGAIPMFNDILKYSGLTTEKLKDSKNSAELLFNAFKKAGAEGGITAQGFTAQAGTWQQLISNLGDSWAIFTSDFVNQTGIFDMAKNVIGKIIDFIEGKGSKLIDIILNAKESFSTSPLMLGFMEFLKGIPEWFNNIMQSDFVQNGLKVIGAIWEGIKAYYVSAWEGLKQVWGVLVQVWETVVKPVFEQLKATLTEVFGKSAEEGDEFKEMMIIIGKVVAYTIGGILIVIALLIAGIAKVIDWVAQWTMKTKEKQQEMADAFKNWWDEKIQPTLDVIIAVITWVVNAIKWQWDNILYPLLYLIYSIWAWIFDKIVGIITEWVDKLKFHWNVLKTLVFNPIMEKLEEVWKKFEKFRSIIMAIWEGMVKGFEIAGNMLKNAIVKPFEDAKKLIEGIAQKIKDSADKINPFHRESPSLVDNVTKGIATIQKEYAKLGQMSFQPVTQLATQDTSGSIGGAGVSLNIDMSGANISSPEIAQDYAERIGDAIIGKLRTTRRSYG